MALDQEFIVTVIVKAAGKYLPSIIDNLFKKDESAQEKARKVVEDTYVKLRSHITDPLFCILLHLEDGNNQAPFELRPKVFPNVELGNQTIQRDFDEQFVYRLKFLSLLGLVTMVGGSEYAISRFGLAYINKARELRDYSKVLWPRN